MYVNVKSVTVLQMKAKSRLFVDKMHFMIATTSRVIFKPFHVPFKGEPSIFLTLMTLIVFEGVNERRIVRNPEIKSLQKYAINIPAASTIYLIFVPDPTDISV